MKTLATIAAIGAALLVGSPAFAGYNSYSHGHKTFHVTQHHNSYHHNTYKPTYHHQPTYHQPTYHKPVYTPTYEHKKVEVCFKWVKNGYGHATKFIIPCPEHAVKKEVTVEKPAETEQPVEQK